MKHIFLRTSPRLVQEWQDAALFAIPFLVLWLPLFYTAVGLPMFLIIVQLPIYMIHQFEEHHHDRFRLFVNEQIGKGRELLAPITTFWINFSVWMIDMIALYLAFYINLSLGLIAIYLPLINGIIHVIVGIRLKRYNPGLLTAVFLFLPLSIWSLFEIQKAGHPSIMYHIIGLGAVILLHLFLVLRIALKMKPNSN